MHETPKQQLVWPTGSDMVCITKAL